MTTKKLKNVFEIVFASFFLLIMCYSVAESANVNAIFFPVFLLTIYGAYKLINKKRIRNDRYDRKWIRAYRFIWVIGFILLFCFAFFLEVQTSWDWGWVVNSSAEYVLNGKEPNTEYFAMYSNNQFITSCVITFFRFIHFVNPNADADALKHASMVLSCIHIQAAVTFIYLTAKEIWDLKKAFLTGALTFAYTPLFLYAQFAYSDTFAIPFSAALSYLFVRMIKSDSVKKNIVYCVLIGLCAGIGGKLKFMVLIILVAGLMTLFFTKKEQQTKDEKKNEIRKKLLYSGVSVIVSLAVFLLSSLTIDPVFKYDESIKDRYAFPPQQWIMMMLNETGGYNRADVRYISNFETYEAKKAAAKEEIEKRLDNMDTVKLVNHILSTKVKRTWANPTLAGSDYVCRNPLNEEGFMVNLFGLSGKNYPLFYAYMGTLHCMIMLALILSAVKMTSDNLYSPAVLMTQLALFGILLFLLIWECNSRYLYVFIPQLLITALYGMSRPGIRSAMEEIKERNSGYKNKTK